jgi:peptidylprolyl isomerase
MLGNFLKRKCCGLFLLTISLIGLLRAEENTKDASSNSEELLLSPKVFNETCRGFGHIIAKNLKEMNIGLNLEEIAKGILEASHGEKPAKNAEQCVQDIAQIQELCFKKESCQNLEKANQFLEENGKKKDIITLIDKELQYRVCKEGTGESIKEDSTPLIRYMGHYIDGTCFVSSKEDEVISLNEMIPGFCKGLIGMKEGEKRELFIHPHQAYEANGYLKPNALLIFEVEVVKPHVAQVSENSTLDLSNTPSFPKEATASSEEKKDIR